jgi:hypothetical protein
VRQMDGPWVSVDIGAWSWRLPQRMGRLEGTVDRTEGLPRGATCFLHISFQVSHDASYLRK